VLPEHIVVQLPQLCGDARLVSQPSCELLVQCAYPGAQLLCGITHLPALHVMPVAVATCSSIEQSLPQAPQLFGSKFVSTQLVPQSVLLQVAASEASRVAESMPELPVSLAVPVSVVEGPSALDESIPCASSGPSPDASTDESSDIPASSGCVVKSPAIDAHATSDTGTKNATRVRSRRSDTRMGRDYQPRPTRFRS
jgi:hypothetical protein